MEILVNIIFLLLLITEYVSFFYTVLQRELREFSKKQMIWIVGVLACVAALGFGEWSMISLYVTGVLLSTGTIYLIFEVPFINVVKCCITAYLALSILENVVVFILGMAADFGEKENGIICLGCIIALLWLYYALWGRKLDKDALYLTGRVWMIVSGVMLLTFGLISYFTYILTEVTGTRKESAGVILITAGGLAIFILIYAMIYYFNTKEKYQTQRDLLEQYSEQQKQYFEDLLKKEQDTRQFRHDITAHLLQIQNFCEKGDHKAAEQYIRELLDEITLINRKGYHVGNDIIDTLLNTYLSPLASECRIKVKGYAGPETGISRADLCVIVSNLLKNAAEAVGRCTREQKEIIFEVNRGKQFLSIKVKNTADPEKISIRDGYPVTGKNDKRLHGLGIRNVKAVAASYNGSYQYCIENGYYIAEVLLQM